MANGQRVVHRPSVAQVDSPSSVKAERHFLASSQSPSCSSLVISLQAAMRWRGVKAMCREGQTGSQKPQSTHMSMRGWLVRGSLRPRRWACGSSSNMTPGLRTP